MKDKKDKEERIIQKRDKNKIELSTFAFISILS